MKKILQNFAIFNQQIYIDSATHFYALVAECKLLAALEEKSRNFCPFVKKACKQIANSLSYIIVHTYICKRLPRTNITNDL